MADNSNQAKQTVVALRSSIADDGLSRLQKLCAAFEGLGVEGLAVTANPHSRIASSNSNERAI